MKNLTTQLRLASLLSLILLASITAYGQLTPSGDSYINTAAPTTNYGAKTTLDVESTQTTFIQFNLSSIPSGYTSADITKATLKLFVDGVTKRAASTWITSTAPGRSRRLMPATLRHWEQRLPPVFRWLRRTRTSTSWWTSRQRCRRG